MIMWILAQLYATSKLGYSSCRAFVLIQSFAVTIRAYPVDGRPEAGLLFVHISIEYEIVSLLLVPHKEVIIFTYPNIGRQLRYKLTVLGNSCN